MYNFRYRGLGIETGNQKPSFCIIENGDPVTIAVIYEDGIAALGIVIAFSPLMYSLTENYYWDSVAQCYR